MAAEISEIRNPEQREKDINTLDAGKIYAAIDRGDPVQVMEGLTELFKKAERIGLSSKKKHDFYLKLYIESLARSIKPMKAERLKRLAVLAANGGTEEIRAALEKDAVAVAVENISDTNDGCSVIIKETLHIIDDNLGNDCLSLRWIAGSIIYTNADYLGKIFKKETGVNFSRYVMEKRMEYAKKLIEAGDGEKIYKVAEKVGYGANPQYFSQVFKKYTGVSPIEYREETKRKRHLFAEGAEIISTRHE